MWIRDLSHDVAYNLYLSHFQFKLIFTNSINSTHLFKDYHFYIYKAWVYKIY